MSVNPPFRADVVGSFLRTEAVHEARAAHAAGTLSDAELQAVEDREILDLIAKEAEAGLPVVTDGEFRREFWHYDFFDGLTGVEVRESDHGIVFQGSGPQPHLKVLRITGPIAWNPEHPFLTHARFVLEHAPEGRTPKFTIPSPTVLHFRLEPDAFETDVYTKPEDIFADLGKAYADAVRAFAELGVTYLQFDDTAWAYLASEAELEKARARGITTDGLQAAYVDVINTALAARQPGQTITTHVCRGNFRSTFISSGGYEPVAESLLAGTDYDGYFLEYDTDRAGGFEPLRFLPEGEKVVVLGLVTSKSGDLEDPAAIRARIQEATQYAPLAQLALSPQCGFASTEEGNILTEDQQWAKIREIIAIADEVWA